MKKSRFYKIFSKPGQVIESHSDSVYNPGSNELHNKARAPRDANRLNSSNMNQRQSGAALIELAIALPVLLILLFFVMYVSHLMSARAALSTAVNSVRIAATRANLPISPTLVTDVEDFNKDRLQPLLASKELEEEAFSSDAVNSYKQFYQSQYPGISKGLPDLEREDLIGMIYAINIVRQSLGNHVKTPCKDPGCLLCLSVPAPWTYAPPGQATTVTAPPPGARFVGVSCEYRPDVNVLSVLNSLIQFVNPNSEEFSGPVIRRQRSMVFKN